jgi:hypothetical protein
MDDIVIKMTPFIFEDGNTYYFEIKRRSGNSYHDLYVYEKVVTKNKFLWKKWEEVEYKCFNKGFGELVKTELDLDNIKEKIKKVLIANSATHQIKGWDGVVGDVSTAMKRDSKLNDLFDK